MYAVGKIQNQNGGICMFIFDEERDEYVAELNGVEFVCDEPEDGFVEEAQKLSKLYFEKLPKCSNLCCPNYSRFMGT